MHRRRRHTERSSPPSDVIEVRLRRRGGRTHKIKEFSEVTAHTVDGVLHAPHGGGDGNQHQGCSRRCVATLVGGGERVATRTGDKAEASSSKMRGGAGERLQRGAGMGTKTFT